MIKKQKKLIFFQRKRNILTKKCQPFQPFRENEKKRRRMGFLHNLIDESCKEKAEPFWDRKIKSKKSPKNVYTAGIL